MTSDQLALAQNAAERLGPKGFMVYSTCSIEVEEGPQLVARLLAGSRLELLSETQRLPQAEGGDGGYHALLRRRPVQSSGAKLGP